MEKAGSCGALGLYGAPKGAGHGNEGASLMTSPGHPPALSSHSAAPGNCQKKPLVGSLSPSPMWKLLSSYNLIRRPVRSMLIALCHVLITHLLMDSNNTASFLNRFLRPGTNSLLSKHPVSIQASEIHCCLFCGVLPKPGEFSAATACSPTHQTGPPNRENPAKLGTPLPQHPLNVLFLWI